jgi:hypothetical protein
LRPLAIKKTKTTCAQHSSKRLSAERLNLIVINAVVPMLLAYGRSKGNEVYCDRAFDFIEMRKAEKETEAERNPPETTAKWKTSIYEDFFAIGYSIISFSTKGTYHVFTSSAVGVWAPGK